MAKRAQPVVRTVRKMRSPIEKMLRDGIVAAAKANRVRIDDYTEYAEGWCVEHGADDGLSQPWNIDAHVGVRSYFVDFIVSVGQSSNQSRGEFAIECDGHEFHEKTKQQASSDKARDRELLIHEDLPTLRFTGSDIHFHLDACVADVYALGKKLTAAFDRSDEESLRMWHDAMDSGGEHTLKESNVSPKAHR